jgi:16S rRNA (adenine1518-N6/adenine1519-N6)-dimethyltransferase
LVQWGHFLFFLDLTNIHDIKALLKKYGLWAKKKYGQNFLIDKNVLKKITESSDLHSDDLVIEVGPGPGVLTRELLPLVKQVIAIEIDHEILPVLKETTHFFRDRIEIVHGHILGFQIPDDPYKVVANIPYHLTSPILRKFLVETPNRPSSLTLLVQKEVAEKICNPQKKSILSLFVEAFASSEIIETVFPESFYPSPKVSSAVVKIVCNEKPKITIAPKLFFSAVKMGFSQPRKKLKNNISLKLLESVGVDADLRAEDLTLFDWERIARKMFLHTD